MIFMTSEIWKKNEFMKLPFMKEMGVRDEAGMLLANFGLVLVK
jgi:hypothetical protein